MLADLLPVKWWFYRLLFWQLIHISFLLWELIIWQTRSWHIYLSIQWWFYRFLLWQLYYSENSSFGWSNPSHCQMAIWEHRFTVKPHIWQLTSLRAQHLADQVLADLPPYQMEISQIPVNFIFHSYSESSTFGWPGLGRSTAPPSNGNFTDSCSNLRAHICQSKCFLINPPPTNGNFTDVGRSTSLSNGNFTDFCSTLRAHISFLLWELIIWQTRSWQIYLPCQMVISQIPALTAHISFLLWELNIWQTRCWLIYPSYFLSGNFTDSNSDNSYFITTLRAYHLADQVLAHLPPHQTAISQIPALLW